jgi:NAD(P)-dependent dehydrogenase (short-subunit alcohol dehydrogenase family)
MTKLEGKVAVITGGSRGIGLAAAQRFVAEGAYVYITGRSLRELDAAVKKIGKNITAVQSDVSNLTDLDHLYATIQQHHDRIDVLFANAGGGELAALGTITEAHFDQTFNTNVKGLLFTVQKALPLLPDGGSIILTASTTTITGIEGLSAYSAAKAAVRSFARGWILDLKSRKIRVNVISPGPTNTPGLNELAKDEAHREQLLALLITLVPLGRLGDPDDVAQAAVFLASDESRFVNGIELFVDGGQAQI